MAVTKLNLDTHAPFKGSAVDSHQNAMLSDKESSLQKATRHVEQKLLQGNETIIAPKQKINSPDTSPLPAVADTIAFFERNKDSLAKSPIKPKLTPPAAKKAASFQAAETNAPADNQQKQAADILAEPAAPLFQLITTPAAEALQNAAKVIEDFFNDWFIKPFKQGFHLKELDEAEQLTVSPFQRFAEARFNEYLEKLDKELSKIQERAKEAQEQAKTDKDMTIFLRLQWIRLIKIHIQFQEEQIEAISDLVNEKQFMIQERQKEHGKTAQSMEEREAQLKPLDWINTAATWTHASAATLSGIIFVASLILTGVTGGLGAIPMAALTGINMLVGFTGGIARAVSGGVEVKQADLNHELNALIGLLQKWQHEDECDTREIEEEMQQLSLKLEGIQKHWEDLMYIAKMQQQVISMSMR